LEVRNAFKSVDTDGSGKVDKREFVNAIRESRVEELGMSVILQQMDGHLGGMEDIFADYKRKLEESSNLSAASEAEQLKRVEALKKTETRRRLMAKEIQTKISELTRTLKKQLAEVQGRSVVVSKDEEFCNIFFLWLPSPKNKFDHFLDIFVFSICIFLSGFRITALSTQKRKIFGPIVDSKFLNLNFTKI
jgi:hypothetical protein